MKNNISIIVFCLIYAFLSVICFMLIPVENSVFSNTPKKYTIVLDAGHGGIDGGATGSFSKESDVNLAITKKLTNLFETGGFNVILTRTEDICLADEHSPSFKLDDMKIRREIIQKHSPDLLISIHCNKFHLSSCVGAQVFYQESQTHSESLANHITDYFINSLPNARKFPLAGDYYVLNSTQSPAVIVECGYLSNSEEEKLLTNNNYQQKIAYSIYAGTMKFLLTKNNIIETNIKNF